MALSIEQFLNQAVASELLTKEDVSSIISETPVDRRPKNGQELARELVKLKKLTRYQAEQIYSGKGKTLVLGNYVVLDKLGQGGMGVVLKAEHKRLKRLVALKVMSAGLVKTPDALKRFHREVEAAAKLRHPHVVATDDADEAKGTHFLVMEYVEGSDLSAFVKKSGPLSVGQAVHCILQAARGLEFAHAQGVVHRDIKPANLLLDNKGNVKILDMGLARIEGDSGSQGELTSTGAVMGTVDYMAPEQALSTKHADARSDIYSLGISLWYLLAGRCAYEGDTLMSKLLAHREAPIPSLCELDNDIPVAVDVVFRKMVAKQAKDRYQTMTEVIRDLESFQRGTSSSNLAMPGRLEDSSLQSFLSNLGSSPSTAAAARTITAPGPHVKVNTAAEVTMVNGNVGVETDPQTMTSVRTQERLTRASRRPAETQGASPPWHRDLRVLLGGGAAAVLALIAVIILIQTPYGTLRVEILDPEVAMKVQGTELTFHSADMEPVSLVAGEKKLIITRGDLSFETETFTLKKRTETRVKVELIGETIVVRSGDTVIAEQPLRSAGVTASTTETAAKSVTNLAAADMSKWATKSQREALDWLFGVGARVGVGPAGGVHMVASAAEAAASGSPVSYVDLGSRSVTDNDLRRLSLFPDIWNLSLNSCPVGDEALAHLSALKQLGILDVSGTTLSDRGLDHLLGCRSLFALHMANTRVTAEGMAGIGRLTSVGELNLSGLDLTADSLNKLENLTGLRVLSIIGCGRISNDAGAALAKLAALEHLNATQTGIGDSGIEAISESRSLKSLILNATKITSAAIPHLSRIQSLTVLNVQGTVLTAEDVHQLAAALPQCEIQSDHGVFKPGATLSMTETPGLSFDGQTSHVELPMFPLDATGPLTIEAWFTAQPGDKPNANDVDAKTDAVWSLQHPQSKAVANFILDRANGGWWFGAGVERLVRTVYYSFTRADQRTDLYGVRHHAAFVRDGDEVKLFVDGQPLRSGGTIVDADKTPLDPSIQFTEVEKFFLGAAVSRDGKSITRFFHGSLDEFRVSQSVRYAASFTPEQVLQNDPDTIALYHFDEGQGDVLTDSSGNKHHGRIVGAKWVGHSARQGLRFDGSSFVAIPTLKYDGISDVTTEAWIVPDRPVFSEVPRVIARHGTNPALQLAFKNDSNRLLVARVASPRWDAWFGTDEIPLRRVHVAAVWKGTAGLGFVDGKLIATEPSAGAQTPVPDSMPETMLGAFFAGHQHFRGVMQEVRISKTARYQSDFTAPQRHSSDENTLALYRFDEGEGDVLNDSSGNNHHGTIVGAKWVKVDDGNAVNVDPDRRAAMYILSVGGTVQINEVPQDYTDVRELPNSKFKLTSLVINDSNQISDAGLAACRGLQHLTRLSMVATVGDVGLESFRECKKLKELVLYFTKVSDAGLTNFSGCRDLTHLAILEG